MGIITHVRENAIAHTDNPGNRGRTEAGDVQVMGAGRLVVLASGYDADRADGGDALPIRTDARVLSPTLKAGKNASYPLGKDRKAYLVPATDAVSIEGVTV